MRDLKMNRQISIILLIFCLTKFEYYVISVKDNDWWKNTVIYQVYPQTFKDSNGDGIGDIKGITSKLDHFVDLGVETIWINPFFKSPMADSGYDVSDYYEINPLYGTMDDFDVLMRELKKRDLKLMVDLVLNHCSDQHHWFQKSVKKIEPYKDYFIWLDPSGYEDDGSPIVPNNWLTLFNGVAWKWVEERKQFYYHQFTENQPDFNLRNPKLINELEEMLRFWIQKGADAIRLDATKHFLEDQHFRDEEYYIAEYVGNLDYTLMNHSLTVDLWDTYVMIHNLRAFVDQEWNEKEESRVVLISEAYTDLHHTMMYYGSPEYPIVHFPFNFNFITIPFRPTAIDLEEAIHSWIDNSPPGSVANWVVENHDNYRIPSWHGNEFSDIFSLLITMLPGVTGLYYGQEIAMSNMILRPDQVRDNNADNLKRDAQRTPMQWDNTTNAGFSTSSDPWLPVNPNYWEINLETEKEKPVSHYKLMKRLISLKKTPTAKYGDITTYVLSKWIFVFKRELKDHETYIGVINTSTESEIIDLRTKLPHIKRYHRVLASSINSSYKEGDFVETKTNPKNLFILRPLSAVFLTSKLTDHENK